VTGVRPGAGGPDLSPQLTYREFRKVLRMNEALSGEEITRIVSGPSGRCLQTVARLARDRALRVEVQPELGEIASVYRALGCLLDLDFHGLAWVRPPLLTSAGRVALEGRSRRFVAHLGDRPFEQAVVQEFERLWLYLHSKTDDNDRARRLALNFWLAAHGLGPYVPHPIHDHHPV
jgi:hypothetical protein